MKMMFMLFACPSPTGQFSKQIDIEGALTIPGKIAGHSVSDDTPPRPLVLVEIQGGVDCPAQSRLVVVPENDAGSRAGFGIVELDGIGEPAGPAYESGRYRSAGCTSDSDRRARTAKAIRNMSLPASIQCASLLLYPR